MRTFLDDSVNVTAPAREQDGHAVSLDAPEFTFM
jgi:hypothetical protein